MQIKIFTISIFDDERMNEKMNTFLRSNSVLHIDSHLVNNADGVYWCFCVKYLDERTRENRKKIDYREELDDASFRRFAKMRQIRKQLSQEEGVPAYVIFTDEEMAALAVIEELTLTNMRQIKGIGEKKVEKYGPHFISTNPDETSK